MYHSSSTPGIKCIFIVTPSFPCVCVGCHCCGARRVGVLPQVFSPYDRMAFGLFFLYYSQVQGSQTNVETRCRLQTTRTSMVCVRFTAVLPGVLDSHHRYSHRMIVWRLVCSFYIIRKCKFHKRTSKLDADSRLLVRVCTYE